MRRSILTCLAALVLLATAAANVRGQNATGVEGVAARVRKARDENRRVIIKFKNGVYVTGRVGETRERGFTFEPDSRDEADVLKGMGMVAAVLYEDVAAVERPSKLKKFFRGVRMAFIGAGAFFIVMPVYGVQALLGDLPEC